METIENMIRVREDIEKFFERVYHSKLQRGGSEIESYAEGLARTFAHKDNIIISISNQHPNMEINNITKTVRTFFREKLKSYSEIRQKRSSN